MINNPSHPKKGNLKSKDCKFSAAGVEYIDYKQTDILERFVNDQGKILPRRVTGTSARHQRQLSTAVKRARFMAMIPYVIENLR
ncbi:MAG: 30S ribosomal protein S18 [Balneolaceae bacterium]|nr:MAG: 30S ribosomal protein S18 [Balneolaceae bacterium]